MQQVTNPHVVSQYLHPFVNQAYHRILFAINSFYRMSTW